MPTRRCASAIRCEAGTLMGPLIDANCGRALPSRRSRLRSARAAQCCAATRRARPGNFVEPTIIRAQADWPIVQTETFAPILYLIEFESLDEAIAMHNAVASRTVVGDFHRQPAARRADSCPPLGSDCGIANVNIGTSGAEIGGAFGGEKDTGGGRESGSDSVEGVHASADQHDQLEPRTAAGSGDRLQGSALGEGSRL